MVVKIHPYCLNIEEEHSPFSLQHTSCCRKHIIYLQLEFVVNLLYLQDIKKVINSTPNRWNPPSVHYYVS